MLPKLPICAQVIQPKVAEHCTYSFLKKTCVNDTLIAMGNSSGGKE
jgi:hypothetical protein